MSKRPPKGPSKGDGRRNNRPPRKHMWKPGKSGNPAGRPKGSKSTGTLVLEILDQIVTLTIGGKPENASLRKAMLLTLAEDFMQRRNLKSLAFLLQLYDAAAAAKRPHEDPGAEDEEILKVLKKMLKDKKDGDDDA